ncbi:uncharacterized protein PHACADRAFT_206140 [Phanerochaete carnosa HHB-10118-sp]|uniref:XRRM domain-containing protein n=1 Tax=Phanerochaete carnosa (strain HHB-10118-sp) TaxID=650164 RepID=K5WKJ8_PHACS|nr:uncharacterized protein PHACADRAFT_206140 [Phanerochaete carnosa HHB-10118-sp]EKM59920.1 hypothetical protein PHACADRAFT_206140 [Phanerochaete carnosa HHB-10118-sp]
MLPFVPRKVAKSLQKRDNTGVSSTAAAKEPPRRLGESSRSNEREVSPAPDHATHSSKGKGKAAQDSQWLSEEEYAAMLLLTMTDYALWSDAELRRTMEFAEESYVPLVALGDRLPLSDDMPRPPEAILVKAIRAHASDIFDARMLMSAPSRAAWYGKNPTSRDAFGGYEVRLKGAKEALHRARNSVRNEWEALTIYIENVPPQYRNVASIYRLVHDLLPEMKTDGLVDRVQHISLPRHHLDKSDDQPKCKGLALVTLNRPEDLDHLLQNWPWQRPKSPSDTSSGKDLPDAIRFGFRTTTKSHWDKLNQEYLSYRQKLLEQIAQEERTNDGAGPSASVVSPPAVVEEMSAEDAPSDAPVLKLSAPYPPGCLVFVRHVHTDTNKTTLRKLLSQVFTDEESELSDDGIDYVDFNKGMNTCHIRLAAPHYTEQLVKFFSDNPIVQTEGLDSTGTRRTDGKQKAIIVELVSGEREELYWAKVPEKVRRQAVEKAVLGSGLGSGGGGEQAETGEPKRKRRRRG